MKMILRWSLLRVNKNLPIMGLIGINLDVSPLLGVLGLTDEAHRLAQEAGSRLNAMAHAKAVELATSRLHSRRGMYIDGLSAFQEGPDLWVLQVEAGIRWIEDGMAAHSLLDSLLASPKAKRAKDGSSYIVVPFDHNKAPTESTHAQRTLQDTVKAEMQKFGVPYGKIENDSAGNPRLGVLHNFDIEQQPLKTFEGPGQGHGPIGAVRQGPTGIPFLRGVQVSQKMVGDKAKRFITTFRIASSKHRDQGRWDMPALKPVAILDDILRWSREIWEQKIGPELVAQLVVNLS